MTVSIQQFQSEPGDLLQRVARGEEIVIVDQNGPVAKLVPVESIEPMDEKTKRAREAIKRIRELRKGNVLGPDLTIRQLINEGRR